MRLTTKNARAVRRLRGTFRAASARAQWQLGFVRRLRKGSLQGTTFRIINDQLRHRRCASGRLATQAWRPRRRLTATVRTT